MIQQSDSDLEIRILSPSHPSHPSHSRTGLNRVPHQRPALSQSTPTVPNVWSDASQRCIAELHPNSDLATHQVTSPCGNASGIQELHPMQFAQRAAATKSHEISNGSDTMSSAAEPNTEVRKIPLEVEQPDASCPDLPDGNVANDTIYTDSERVSEDVANNANGRAAETNGSATLPPNPLVTAQPAETKELGFWPVLRNRNFLALWSGQVFSQLADKVYLVLMIALIDSHFHSGSQTISAWVSAIMIAFTIPAVLFGSLAGVFVDRWSKQAVLVATNLLRGGLVISLPLLLWLAEGWGSLAGLPAGFYLLLTVTFLVSTLTQFFAPAEQAAIPLIVERRHLLSANSLYTTTMMGSVIIGFAVGQPVLVLADSLMSQLGWVNGKELVVGGSYAIAGLVLLSLQTGEKTISEHEAPHILADLRDGLRYLSEQQRVRNALIQLVILFSVFAALSVLAVRLAEVIPGLKPSQFGFLMAAGGLGLGISAGILGHYGQGVSHTWLSLVGSLGVAASLTGIALLPHHLWLVLLLVTFMGAFGALVAVPMQTTIQKETPPDMRGKVFGLQNNGINIALTLPLALAGVAETLFGLKAVFLGLAAIAIAGSLFTWYICRTSSRTSKKANG